MAGYGGYQQGPARLYLDEDGNQQVAYDSFEVSPQSSHENVFKTYARTQGQVMDPRKSMLPYLLLYASGVGAPAAAGLQGSNAAAAGTGYGTTAGSSLGSVAGHSAATGLSSNAMSGASFMGAGGAAPAATGMSTLGSGTLAGSSIAPTAFGVSGAGVGLPASMAAGGGASAIPTSVGNASFQTSLPGNATPMSNPYSLGNTSASNPTANIGRVGPNSQLPSNVTQDLASNYGQGYPWQSGMQNTPWYQNAGKAAALKGAEAAPSLIMSAFMGKDARANQRAATRNLEADTVAREQRNAYREWMRPMVEQAMRAMIMRLPISMKGNLPQNFPTFPAR